jgi:ketosteroid isomerase-like protein
MTNKETVLAFINRINAHDVDRLVELMADEHCFIDAHGNQVRGKERMITGWRSYFNWFPVYAIEVNEIFESEGTLAMFGIAGSSLTGSSLKERPEASWSLPAAWKAIVKDSRIMLWQVFADTKICFRNYRTTRCHEVGWPIECLVSSPGRES